MSTFKATYNNTPKFWNASELLELLEAHFIYEREKPAEVMKLLNNGQVWELKHSTTGAIMTVKKES